MLYRLIAGLLFLSACGALSDEVDDYIRTEMKNRQIPGLALSIVQNGKTVKSAAFGLANVELQVPVNAETAFEIGSLTKQLTAGGILILSQEGKIKIDEKIPQYLKNVPRDWENITVRHLLTHTSGIKSYTGLEGFELRRHLTKAQFIQAIGAQPLEFQPGSSWNYSNSGYSLLGYIIEEISGESYWNFLYDRIFKPLNMSSTTNRLPALIIPNRASGYEQTNHVLINRDYDLTDVFSAGAFVSTIGDLVKWNAALDGDEILNAASKHEMWTPQLLPDGKSTKYGFGWRIGEVEGHKNMGHGGSTSGFSATLQRFPEDRLAIIILTNTDEQIATALAKRIANFYFKKSRIN